MEKKTGRPALPEGQKRDTFLQARVKPAAAEKFRAKCERLGIKSSDGVRQALAQWVKE